MRLCRPGVTEQYIGGQIDGIAASYGCIVFLFFFFFFQSIVTMHGEDYAWYPSPRALEAGKVDAV